MAEFQDEMIGKALSTDSEVIPRYTITRPDGTVLAENVQLELTNPITREGTLINQSALCKDNTSVAFSGQTNMLPDRILQYLWAQFKANNTVFNADGSITETSGNLSKTTIFNSDGSITEELKCTYGTIIKTTVFNSDNSISEVISQ